MDEFGFWQQWGMELDDRSFANAFTALGVLAAPLPDDEPFSIKDLSGDLFKTSRGLEQAFCAMRSPVSKLRDILQRSRDIKGIVPWRFPGRDQSVKIGEEEVLLSSLKPSQMADAWQSSIGSFGEERRFQIIGYPEAENVAPWFRLLFEADPQWDANALSKSVHIAYNAAGSALHMEWPLRLGYLDGNGGEAIVQRACNEWESGELAGAVKIDRGNDNCDILVFDGWTRQLLKTLLEMPGSQKTNLVIVRGRLDESISSVNQHLQALSSESQAKGFVFIDPGIADEAVGQALNRFVRNLSHNSSLDLAVSGAFAGSYPTDPVIFLSRELADFQISRFIKPMSAGFGMLPEKIRIEMQPQVLMDMNIPAPPGDDMSVPKEVARTLAMYRDSVDFGHEYRGARGLKAMSRALDDAHREAAKEQRRFLQEQTYIKKEGELLKEHRAFLKGAPTLIRVRIGPPDEEWIRLEEGFPEEKLPKDRKEWRLSVVLTEPDHLKKAMRKSIKLPRLGPSTECTFIFKPGDHPVFEGRITVLHRGRVLQTGVLKGNVFADESGITAGSEISFSDILSVRSNIGDLDERRQFDMAFVLNHTADERPRLTAVASKHAWCLDLTQSKTIASYINEELSKVANSVKDYSGGLDSEKNRALIVRLANLGNELYWSIVEEQLKKAKNQPDIAGEDYIQIVSTQNEAILPFEFIYDHEAPEDDAELCPSWRDALDQASCRSGCTKDKIKHVCPLGFWGIRKVIERHDMTPEFAQDGKDYFLQSEPTADRPELPITGAALVAASEKVKDEAFDPVISACTKRLGSSPQRAKDWENWAALVQEHKPHVLLALAHTDGDGIDATLEIGGKAIKSNQIREKHVRLEGTKDYPLVALLGCDTVGTALEYGSHVRWFRRRGAGVVIGTIATVFGGHAAKVAEMLIEGFKDDEASFERLGEVIRSVKRKALLNGLVMALCVVAYGDADWKLR
ncbi:MAG TPA: hypothetical protein PLR60_05205 [Syntrophorhabdaceae bacterium]|nr:hypothetical protein [Syntrophorhabdaceae bacterium]